MKVESMCSSQEYEMANGFGNSVRECICPVVKIEAKPGQVSSDLQRRVADMLHATVELSCDDRTGGVMFGKHRDDCPCK